eukprot:scaffold128923_cov15-Tisochrysis_lutea.AAC.1
MQMQSTGASLHCKQGADVLLYTQDKCGAHGQTKNTASTLIQTTDPDRLLHGGRHAFPQLPPLR